MKIALASDHRGFKLKSALEGFLKSKGYNVKDFGTYSEEPCDYPDYVYQAALAVKQKQAERAIVICYSGIGSSIVANKVKGIRAALVHNLKLARLCREHNNSNVLALPAGFVGIEQAKKIVSVWLKTDFVGGRHLRRLNKISQIEKEYGQCT